MRCPVKRINCELLGVPGDNSIKATGGSEASTRAPAITSRTRSGKCGATKQPGSPPKTILGVRIVRIGETKSASDCSLGRFLEVLAKRLVGRMNTLEPLFRLSALLQVAFKFIRMPELGRRPICPVNCRFRLRRLHDSKDSGMLKANSAYARHSLASPYPGGRESRSLRSLSSSCCALVSLLLQPLNNVRRSLGRKSRIVELPIGVRDDLFLLRDLLSPSLRAPLQRRSCGRRSQPHRIAAVECLAGPAEIRSTNRTSLTPGHSLDESRDFR